MYSCSFHIYDLSNLKVIHDLYFQYLTQILSKTTSFTKPEERIPGTALHSEFSFSLLSQHSELLSRGWICREHVGIRACGNHQTRWQCDANPRGSSRRTHGWRRLRGAPPAGSRADFK
jgi:hypothetical protein